MRALAKLAAGPGNVELVERPPAAVGPGQVRLNVLAAGVCGTDLHIEAGEYPASPPVTMGHEVCGVVSETGPGVDEALLGVRAVSETFFSVCGACRWCRQGRTNLCPDRRSIGSSVDGAFAPTLVVPAVNLHPVPDWIEAPAAALLEPLACVCNCLLDPAAIEAGDRVLVTGPGPIGILAAQVARALGGGVTIVGVPSDGRRLAVGERLGFATTTEPAGLARFEVVVECSGAEAAAAVCLDAVERGGRYVQVGVFGKPVTTTFDRIFQKELVVSSGLAATSRSWARAIRLVETRAVELGALVSEVAPLADWRRVFDDLRSGRSMKCVFDPRLG